MDNPAELTKIYLEIGVLGLCAIFTIANAWYWMKHHKKHSDKQDERIDKKDDIYVKDKHDLDAKFSVMLELLQKQNQEYQEQQAKNTEILIQTIINGVTNHVPSEEENNKLTKISEEIDKNLQEVLLITNASRTSLVQYHNGGKGINRQSFLKMSMTNEQVQLGVKPFIQDFKDQFRNVLAYFVKQLNDEGKCYISDFEDIQSVDTSMYEFLKDRGIQAKYGLALRNNSGIVIGFVCLEYENRLKADEKLIDKIFREKQKVFETLLNL